ncbi:MAG: ribonuclease Z [Flavobacterium sp.]
MKLTILGCYAATPRTLTFPTSQVLEIKNHLFLIDCGEGTQIQLRRHKVKFSKINHIFISHLHGDHFFGLIGLISTFMLLGREKELHIYGPKGIKEIILLQLKLGNAYTNYPLYFHERSKPIAEVLFEDEKVKVSCFPMKHRIPTHGFLFEEKNKERKLNIEAIEHYGIETLYFQKIKYGGDIQLEDGRVIDNRELTFDPVSNRSYAYCSDTIYDPDLVEYIKGATVLYHESTFLEKESHLAERTMHSTAKEAAFIAQKANVQHLILGHFSTRYGDTSLFKQEAEIIFQQVMLADDGKVFDF